MRKRHGESSPHARAIKNLRCADTKTAMIYAEFIDKDVENAYK